MSVHGERNGGRGTRDLVSDSESEPGPYFNYLRQRGSGWARSVVEDYWVIQAERCRAQVELVLPDACVELYFNLGPVGRTIIEGRGVRGANDRDERPGVRGESCGLTPHPSPLTPAVPAPRRSWVVGPHSAPLLVAKETRDCDIVGVRLHPGVTPQLLGVSARELEGTAVDLDAMWGSVVDEIRERLSESADAHARVRVVEQAIVRRLARTPAATDASRVRALCRSVGELADASVGAVAKAHGLTHRQVIQLFDLHVGLKPKAYHRVHRLRQVIRDIHSPRPAPWARLALQHGYCDQAHLINDFRKLTGLTPVEYAARRMSVGQGSVPYRLAAAS